MLLDECGDFINKTVARYAIILENGTILKATLDEKLIFKVLPLVKPIFRDIPIGNMICKAPWVFVRITEFVIVVLATKARESVYRQMLEAFIRNFGTRLNERYVSLPKTFNELVKFNIFALARQAGPEPIAWNMQNGTQLSQDQIWKYAMSGMMMLINEVEGAKHTVLNYHSFIHEGYLGIIYLFHIPLAQARGGAFDAAIMTMINYEDRTLVYENHDMLERIYCVTGEDFISKFQELYSENIQAKIENRDPFFEIIAHLQERLGSISFVAKKAEVVKSEMMDSLRELGKIL